MDSSLKQSNDSPEVALEIRPIILIGGEYFVTEKIFLPDEISRKNMDSFVEMRLEGLSPFAVEQLYWGYFYDKKERSVLLYAMYADRLSLDQRAELLGDEVGYVLPSFIVGCGQKYEEKTISFVSAGGSLCALFWDEDSNVPSRIESIALSASIDESRSELLESLSTDGYVVQEGYWELEKTELLANRSVRFESRYYLNGQPENFNVLILSEKDGIIWSADIRPRLLTSEKHKQERMGRILWIAVVSAAVALGVLAIIEIFGIMGNVYLTSRKSLFKSQEERVKLIEGQESLVQKIEHLGHDYYGQLKMLEILNNYRPKMLYFTSVVLGSKNDVEIEGVAQSVDDLNKYTDDLNKSGLVEKFEVGQILSRQGRVTFKMDVTLKVDEEVAEKAEEVTEKVEATAL